MAPKLELFYPAQPFIVTQKWGVKNDAYIRFGFTHHNGIDFTVDTDGFVKAMCNGRVVSVGDNPTGAGRYVVYRTPLVFCEGVECYVEFYYMHAEKILVKVGDEVEVGTTLMIADNTGFSTGPHTHISAYRISKEGGRIDMDMATNRTFDFSKYFIGKYADDYFEVTPFTKDIFIGEKSQEVTKLQVFLQRLGFFPVNVETTGFYGEITRKSVYRFEEKYLSKSIWSSIFVYLNHGDSVRASTRKALNNLLP